MLRKEADLLCCPFKERSLCLTIHCMAWIKSNDAEGFCQRLVYQIESAKKDKIIEIAERQEKNAEEILKKI